GWHGATSRPEEPALADRRAVDAPADLSRWGDQRRRVHHGLHLHSRESEDPARVLRLVSQAVEPELRTAESAGLRHQREPMAQGRSLSAARNEADVALPPKRRQGELPPG